MNYFYFYLTSNSFKPEESGKILRIPKNITSELEIFNYYEKELNIPEYFGKNWDAFYDNFKGLDFVHDKNVILIHEDIPFAKDQQNKKVYLEILFDSVRHWWEFHQHKVFVYFPKSCECEVRNIIDSRAYE